MFAETDLRGFPVFSFTEFSQFPHFIFAISSRQTDSALGYDEATEPSERRNRLSDLLGIDGKNLFTLDQVHSATTIALSELQSETELGPADGLIVTQPGLFASVRTADCMPVIAVDPDKRQFGLFHMGWRGGKERILERGLREFFRLTGATRDKMIVGLGPCIRACCYEVGVEVREAFSQAAYSMERTFVGNHLDLIAVAQQQLELCGISQFLDSGLCTACRADLFYSYRREATVSRMWTIAGFRH
jgi:YfiH family protein